MGTGTVGRQRETERTKRTRHRNQGTRDKTERDREVDRPRENQGERKNTYGNMHDHTTECIWSSWDRESGNIQ